MPRLEEQTKPAQASYTLLYYIQSQLNLELEILSPARPPLFLVCDIYKEHEKKKKDLGVVELKVNPQRFIIKLDRTLSPQSERHSRRWTSAEKRMLLLESKTKKQNKAQNSSSRYVNGI